MAIGAKPDNEIERLQRSLIKLRAKIAKLEKENKLLKRACRRAGLNLRGILSVRNNELAEIGILYGRLELGQVGYIDRFSILQVIDANNALAKLEVGPPQYQPLYIWPRKGPKITRAGQGVVDNPLPWVPVTPPQTETVWLTGISTEGLVDGQQLRGWGPFKIGGTRQYESQSGLRTIFVLEPFKLEQSRK
jgi:hypothetical protein